MPMAENLAAFFTATEFASVAVATPRGGAPQTANVIFDAPTEVILGGDVLSDEHTMLYPASEFVGLRAGDTCTIAGTDYRVRGEPKAVDDGALRRASLTRV